MAHQFRLYQEARPVRARLPVVERRRIPFWLSSTPLNRRDAVSYVCHRPGGTLGLSLPICLPALAHRPRPQRCEQATWYKVSDRHMRATERTQWVNRTARGTAVAIRLQPLRHVRSGVRLACLPGPKPRSRGPHKHRYLKVYAMAPRMQYWSAGSCATMCWQEPLAGVAIRMRTSQRSEDEGGTLPGASPSLRNRWPHGPATWALAAG